MIGALLLTPVVFVRYVMPIFIGHGAMKRLAFTPPPKGVERVAFCVYLLSMAAIFISLFFIKISVSSILFYIGVAFYGIGVLLYAVSVVHFGQPSEQGPNAEGVYRFSRNPIYVAFFLFLLGCALMTQSPVFFLFVVLYQISVHWVILAEERWCLAEFGDKYARYMRTVRRYL